MTTLFDSYLDLRDSYRKTKSEIDKLCEGYIIMHAEELQNGRYVRFSHWHYPAGKTDKKRITIVYKFCGDNESDWYESIDVPIENLL